jgi:two-component system, NtrC family, response regulator AtoC
MLDRDCGKNAPSLREDRIKTILLIDNEIDSLTDLSEFLDKSGYAVIAMRDASSALSALRQTAVDLVITSSGSEGRDGLEMLLSIKKTAPSIPTIMLSSYGTIETYLQAISLGVFEFLIKPVKHGEIGRIVKAALERPAGLGPSLGTVALRKTASYRGSEDD